MSDFWNGKHVCVTGGASFVGSHLSERLGALGARLLIVDDLSSGKRENLKEVIGTYGGVFIQGDLRDIRLCRDVLKGQDVVFHLAAVHGGRGFVEQRQAECSANFGLDSAVIQTAAQAGVKLIFSSSGCVYPNHLQGNPEQELYLTENMVGPPYDPDHLYGQAKLATELTLRELAKSRQFPCVSLRYFTCIGPRMKENHAIGAMMARAFLRQDPFEVWGTGEQIRNWTWVGDIVEGTILAAEKVDDGSAINLGTQERITVAQAARIVCTEFGYQPELRFQPGMPTGPLNRVADNTVAKTLLGWPEPLPFREAIARIAKWYISCHTAEEVSRRLEAGALLGR